MPLEKYFGGHGKEVMSKMKKKYGGDKGKQVFYATANKRGQVETGPSEKTRKKHGV